MFFLVPHLLRISEARTFWMLATFLKKNLQLADFGGQEF